jgi:hypothetical protein
LLIESLPKEENIKIIQLLVELGMGQISKMRKYLEGIFVFSLEILKSKDFDFLNKIGNRLFNFFLSTNQFEARMIWLSSLYLIEFTSTYKAYYLATNRDKL